MLYMPVHLGRRAIYAYDLERSTMVWRHPGTPVPVGLLAVESGFVSVDLDAVVRRHEEQRVLWERELDPKRFVHARPLLVSDRVIVTDDQGMVYALDPQSGAPLWTSALGAPVYTGMATHAGRIYIPTTRGRIFALEAASGTILWEFAYADSSVRMAAPVVDSLLVVSGGSNGNLVALDAATGEEVWSWKGPDAIAAAPYMNAHAVYVGTMGGTLYALDREKGTVRWQETLRGRIKSKIVGYDDFLVVLSEPRYVYLLRSDEADS